MIERSVIDELAQYSSPAVSDGIEQFDVRPRDHGVSSGAHPLRYLASGTGPLVGYAATVKVTSRRGAEATGSLTPQSWRHVLEQPSPRILVVEDVDDEPGLGAFLGEVNAHIQVALGCAGVITDGAVRDVAGIAATGLRVLAGTVSVSHAYTHIVEVGCPVTIAGLRIEPGELLHADEHGVVVVPADLAARIPDAIRTIEARERRIIEACQTDGFTIEGLIEAFRPPAREN